MKIVVYNNYRGNLCYLNSILHILHNMPIFFKYICNLNIYNEDTLIYELKKLFINSLIDNIDYNIEKINHISFYKKLCELSDIWDNNEQQDSQELLTFILDKFINEIGIKHIYIPGKYNKPIFDNLTLYNWNNNESKNYSELNDIFYSWIEEINICSKCNGKSRNIQSYTSISLCKSDNKEEDIYDLINNFRNDIIYSNCELCGLKNIKKYRISIFKKLSKILILNIKRFDNNNNKIHKLISYYETLYLDDNKYELFAINNHLSYNTLSGHYISYIKNIFDNKWYLYDDGNEPILLDNILTNKAYILFYVLK
jgi:ubiquitin C-terminal hydrolase